MTPTQYRAALKKLGLSQHKAARLLRIAPRTSQGYALGEYPVPWAEGAILKWLLDGKLTIKDVEDCK